MSDPQEFPMPSAEARELTIELFAATAAKLNYQPGHKAAEAAFFTMAYVIVSASQNDDAARSLREAARVLTRMSLQPAYLEALKMLLTLDGAGGVQ